MQFRRSYITSLKSPVNARNTPEMVNFIKIGILLGVTNDQTTCQTLSAPLNNLPVFKDISAMLSLQFLSGKGQGALTQGLLPRRIGLLVDLIVKV